MKNEKLFKTSDFDVFEENVLFLSVIALKLDLLVKHLSHNGFKYDVASCELLFNINSDLEHCSKFIDLFYSSCSSVALDIRNNDLVDDDDVVSSAYGLY